MERIIRYRWLIIGLSFMITIAVSFSLKDLSIDPDLKNYFPESMESMVATNQVEEKFGNQDIIMIIFENGDIINRESLERIRLIDRKLKRTSGIRKTTSLFSSNHIYGEDGVMYVEPAVKRMPENQEEAEALKNSLATNDMVMDIVLADDFKSTAIIVALSDNASEDSVFASIRSILQDTPGSEKIHFGGLPYIRQAINKDIRRDGIILVPAALLLMIIFLFAVFREARGVVLPFLVVVMSCLLALSLIPLIGWKFYLISLLVPIMLIAVANDYGIHIMARYQEVNVPGNTMSMKEMAVDIASNLWRPILVTGLTTVAGIAALLAHTLIPAREMAIVAGIGILAALAYSVVLLPAILSLLKKSVPVYDVRKKHHGPRGTLLNRLAYFIIRHNRRIPATAAIITLIIGVGAFFLHVDSNEENFFPEKHPVKQASALINDKYGGSENLSILFHGDLKDPAMLQRMDHYKHELLREKEIDLIMAFPDVIKEISKALYDPGSPEYDQIPPTRDAVAQFIELYQMNGDPGELDQLVDFNYKYAHMIVRINSVNNRTVNQIMDRIRELTFNDASVEAVGGYGYVRSQLANQVVRGQFYSLGIALLIVFIMIAIIFKSIKAGLITSIPLMISIVILFGTMGFTGVKLDVATALLSSMMIGVGVDYTIHFLWRYREERRQFRPKKEAVITTLNTTGRGIIFNALSVVVGFLVLIVSSFTPIRFFGILVVLSILSCLTGALVLLPAMVLKYNFRFLEPTGEKEDAKNEQHLLKAI